MRNSNGRLHKSTKAVRINRYITHEEELNQDDFPENITSTKPITNKIALRIMLLMALFAGIVMFFNKSFENQYRGEELYLVSDVDANTIGYKIEDEKLINFKNMYALDYTFDYRFDEFKDTISSAYVKSALSSDKIEELFIIKTTNVNAAIDSLKKYKQNLIESFKNNNDTDNLNIASNAIISSKGDIVYYIATSENNKKIEKTIKSYI